jgi:hypothetical protein
MPWHHQKGWVYISTKNSQQANNNGTSDLGVHSCGTAKHKCARNSLTHRHEVLSRAPAESTQHVFLITNSKVFILCKKGELRVRFNSPAERNVGGEKGLLTRIRLLLSCKYRKGEQLIG